MNYEEKLNLAKEALESGSYDKETIEYIFPELKESEEERIRKEILEYFQQFENEELRGVNISDWIAWLKKQGDIEEINEVSYRMGINRVLDNPESYGLEKQGEQKSKKEVDNLHNYLYGEQKPADKIEPKFKVGDWVVDIIYDKAMQVLFLEDDGYEFENGIWIPYTDAKERVHLWTIQDAKDGDVLQLGKVTAIFKKYIGNEHCICYCSYCKAGGFEIPIENEEDNNYGCYNATPANKEQRGILFQKMNEAGYEWSDKDRKLIKIVK